MYRDMTEAKNILARIANPNVKQTWVEEIDNIANKMRQETAQRIRTIEGEVTAVANRILAKSRVMIESQAGELSKVSEAHRKEMRELASATIGSYRATLMRVESEFLSRLQSGAQTELKKIESLMQEMKYSMFDIKQEILNDVNAKLKDALDVIDKTAKSIKPPEPVKEEAQPGKQPHDGPVTLDRVGNHEHFVNEVQVETHKDLEDLKRMGDSESFLKEK